MEYQASAPVAVRFKHKRPRKRWVRFVKAASKDLAQDIHFAAIKRGFEVTLASQMSSSDVSCSGDTTRSANDGSKVDVYACLSGLLQHLKLSEEDTGVVAMMTYGLMKAKDLEVLPTTWRAQLVAALRMALLHGVKPESESTRAADELQTLVELWRPTWRQDYDFFLQRSNRGALLMSALAAAQELQKSPEYDRTESDWDREEQAPTLADTTAHLRTPVDADSDCEFQPI
jgi:hypothetical protein